MKRGRPTKSKSINLEEKIYKYYSRGISAETVAQQLGLDRKTVYTHYKKISDRIETINETNFFEVIKSKTKQIITCYDNMLLDCYFVLDYINRQLEHKIKDTVRQSLQNRKIAINKEIRNILNEKAERELNISLSDSLEDAIDKVISKRAKS